MIIGYNNGQVFEAVLLARAEDTMRVAVQGSDDVMELKQVHGVWISDDCEPVRVEFAWERQRRAIEVTEADCVCPHELASHLIQLLFSGENEAEAAAPMGGRALAAAMCPQVF